LEGEFDVLGHAGRMDGGLTIQQNG
jgi:hypothetical protein